MKFREHTSIELYDDKSTSGPLRFNLSPGSSISYKSAVLEEKKQVDLKYNARLIQSPSLAEIDLNQGRVAGLPVLIDPGMQLRCTLKIAVPKEAEPGESLIFRVIQRNRDGQVIGGISVQINVVKKKKIQKGS